jgi:competence protein ComEA
VWGLTKNETTALAFLAAAFIVGSGLRLYRQQRVPIPERLEPVEPKAVVDSVRTETNGLVSLNGATQEELERLPGVGPVLAGRIIEYRQNRQGFRSLDELANVQGIGTKKLAALRNRIRLD